MPIRGPAILLMVLLLVLPAVPNTAAAGECAASTSELLVDGTVSRGETFAWPLANGLAFQLRPRLHGWQIWIGDPARPEDNYATVATPPFHGPNPTLIQGWHFRNMDNTGPNVPGPTNVNAPQHVRPFRFVLGKARFDRARETLGVVLWPGDRSPAEAATALQAYRAIENADGTLRITDLELGNLAPQERAWIERMGFTLRLCLAWPRG
jgi:hypothetical protein